MGKISKSGKRLIWTFNGEKLVVEPWGDNSFRVRSTMMGEIQDTDYALLPAKETKDPVFKVSAQQGSITNGKIKAVLTEDAWSKTGTLAFYNQKNELLLKNRDGMEL